MYYKILSLERDIFIMHYIFIPSNLHSNKDVCYSNWIKIPSIFSCTFKQTDNTKLQGISLKLNI